MKKNEYLLSLAELKNIIKKQSREEIIQLLLDSYKVSPQVKEYITAKYGDKDTLEQIFQTYKNKIKDVFFPKSMRAQFKIGEARKVISNFKKLCSDEKLVIDLMLYYVEMGVEFTNTYGDINESFYNSVERMYGVHEVASSTLVTQTIENKGFRKLKIKIVRRKTEKKYGIHFKMKIRTFFKKN